MVQGTNLQRINRFVNPKSGGLYLAKPGHTAGWLAGWLADEIQVESENFKVCCKSKYLIFGFV